MEYVICLKSEDSLGESFVHKNSTYEKGQPTISVENARRWESKDDAENFRANSTWLRKRLTGTGLKAAVRPITDFLVFSTPATPPTGGHAVNPMLGNTWGNPYDAPIIARLENLETAFLKLAKNVGDRCIDTDTALGAPTLETLQHEMDLLRKANAKLVHDWNEERGKAADAAARHVNAERERVQAEVRFTSERNRRETAEHRIDELLELIANLRRYRTEDARTITRIKRDLDSVRIALAKAQDDANLGGRQPLREKIEKQADLISKMREHFGTISRAAKYGANLHDESAEAQKDSHGGE